MSFIDWFLPWKTKAEMKRMKAVIESLSVDANKYLQEKCDHSVTLGLLKASDLRVAELEAELAASKVAHEKIRQWIIVTHGLSGEMKTSGQPVDILNRKNLTLGMKV